MITGVGVQGYRGSFFGSGLSCKDRIEVFFYWLHSVAFCIIIMGSVMGTCVFLLCTRVFSHNNAK